MSSTDSFVWRANSVTNYFEANRRVLDKMLVMHRQRNKMTDYDQMFSCPINSKLLGDNLISSSVTFEESDDQFTKDVHKSILGADCSVGKGIKLTNCVLFTTVKIGNYCKLENCIFGSQSVIEDGCELSNVVVAASQKVKSKSKLSNETIKQIVHFQ